MASPQTNRLPSSDLRPVTASSFARLFRLYDRKVGLHRVASPAQETATDNPGSRPASPLSLPPNRADSRVSCVVCRGIIPPPRPESDFSGPRSRSRSRKKSSRCDETAMDCIGGPMRFLALLILYPAVTGTARAEPSPVGFRTLAVRNIQAVTWYPTRRSTPVTTVAGNRVFVGVSVVEDAPRIGDRPSGRAAHARLWRARRNQAWLAERLARAGLIAVAPNHPGTTFGDMDPAWTTHLAERPRRVSQVLDALLADPDLGSRIDRERISVIGHSLGGSTALFLAGGVFDPPLLVEACGSDTTKTLCDVDRKGGLTATMPPASARDPRISAAVLLDMEGVRGFTPAGLARLSVPILALVSGVEDPALPLNWEGRTQAARLPAATSRYAEIVGATHLSFMSACKPGAAEVLKQDAFICEGETVPPPELHAAIARMVIDFPKTDRRSVFARQSP